MLHRIVLGALAAVPLVSSLPGCGFQTRPAPGSPPFDAGPDPHAGLLFCNIEKDRHCASPSEVAMGIDVAKQYENGLWLMPPKSGNGLDFSPAAQAACGGSPQAVIYQGQFPAGMPVCVSEDILTRGLYSDANAACKAYCESLGLIDGDDHRYRCDNIAWVSIGSEDVAPDACTAAGSVDPAFVDLRTLKPQPVVWRDALLVNVSGNSLSRLNAAVGWTAGAASTRVLSAGAGYVEFTASETTRERMCGLAIGAPPDNAPGFADISFAVYLQRNGVLKVYESGIDRGQDQPYAPGDRLRIAVANGHVQYSRNGRQFYTSSDAVAYPIRVDASLYDPGATLIDVDASF